MFSLLKRNTALKGFLEVQNYTLEYSRITIMKIYIESHRSAITHCYSEASLKEVLDSRHTDHVQRVSRRLLVLLGRVIGFDASPTQAKNSIFEIFEDFDLAPRIQLKIG